MFEVLLAIIIPYIPTRINISRPAICFCETSWNSTTSTAWNLLERIGYCINTRKCRFCHLCFATNTTLMQWFCFCTSLPKYRDCSNTTRMTLATSDMAPTHEKLRCNVFVPKPTKPSRM